MDENKEVNSTDPKREKVRVIPLSAIDDAPDHPFGVRDDDEMAELVESISTFGVINPVIVRKGEGERYELISGHRRKFACAKLGIDTLPVIVRDLSREEAIIFMVDSNLQREHILPSERAKAYKMKMEAIKQQGRRTDLTSGPMVPKLSREQLGESNGECGRQISRYIRLNNLIPELLEDVDMGKIAFRPAVELSYLDVEEQKDLSYDYICMYLDKLADGSIPYERRDRRIFRLIWEHKKCMLGRIREVEEQCKWDASLSADYNEVVALADKIRFIYSKFVIKYSNKDLENIQICLMKMKVLESELLDMFADKLLTELNGVPNDE